MKKSVLKLTTVAALSAIGVLLMSVLTVEYPIFPYLKIEFSDFVVIFTFPLCVNI
jgi:riboflavin transporter FmnP